MRKTKNAILYFFSFMFFIICIWLLFKTNINIDNKLQVKTKANIPAKSILLIEADPNISNKSINLCKSYLSLIPEKLLETIKNENWKIVITNNNLNEEMDIDYQVIAYSDFNKKIIYLSNDAENIKNSIIHELAHTIEYIIDKKTEFNMIFEKEKELLFQTSTSSDFSYYQEDKYEYFAEAFNLYFLDNNTLKNKAPKTYDFIENIIFSFK